MTDAVPDKDGTNMQFYQKRPEIVNAYRAEYDFELDTTNGVFNVSRGDYIVCNNRGRFVYKAEDFESMFEPLVWCDKVNDFILPQDVGRD